VPYPGLLGESDEAAAPPEGVVPVSLGRYVTVGMRDGGSGSGVSGPVGRSRSRTAPGPEVPASCNALTIGCTYSEADGRAAPAGMVMSDHDDADPGQEQEWLRESDLINGGPIIIGVYMVQPFLTAGSLDLPARICVAAFSVAIPLLAALVLVNRRELSRRRATRSRFVVWTRADRGSGPRGRLPGPAAGPDADGPGGPSTRRHRILTARRSGLVKVDSAIHMPYTYHIGRRLEGSSACVRPCSACSTRSRPTATS
jgi:hypothetical protein